MYTKKILSAVAAVAIVSTGLFAFETNESGEIVTRNSNNELLHGGYLGGTPSNSDLNLSTNQLGDALIFPFYKAADGWETEIVIRNTSPHATIAKVSVYEHAGSNDAGDFNVYLSPYDVMRFTMKFEEGSVLVFSDDGSVPQKVTNPSHGVDNDDAIFKHGLEDPILTLNNLGGNEQEGYVIVYGMAQYNDGDTRTHTKYGTNTKELNYHGKHLDLFKDYRRVLDDCRNNWRSAYTTGNMVNGMMRNAVPSPDTNIGETCATTSESVLASEGYQLENFGDVSSDTLIGTVRVYKEDGQQSRDLLLPAKALSNFTDENMMLWAEGEFAALHDRRIEDGRYNVDAVLADSKTFMVSSTYYTFDKDAIANQITVTQPMKKILAQLVATNGSRANSIGEYLIDDGSAQGGFELKYFLRDEDENDPIKIPIVFEEITSPHNVGADEIITFRDEMQLIKDTSLELAEGAADPFKNKETSGFAYLNFIGADGEEGLPAIVTQMSGSKIGNIAQTNWIYAPTVSRD
jgi:hypothetical protein